MSTIFNISDKIKLTNNPFPLLLNTYTGAAAAYSLRQLDYNYTGSAVKIRRGSDNTEQDINFVNGELDTATLESFVNNGNVLNNPDITSATGWTIGNKTTYNASTEAFDLVDETGLTVRQSEAIANHTYTITIVLDSVTSGGIKVYAGGTQSAIYSTAGTHTFDITAGTSNTILGINPAAASLSISSFYAVDTTADGFVTTWYDQSGNGNNATQTTATVQPKIVSLGSTILENGKAAFEFDGSDDVLRYQGDLVTDSVSSIFTSLNVGSFGGFSTFIDRYNNPDNGTASIRSTSGANTLDINSITTTNASYQNSQLLVSAFQSSGSFAAYIDGASVGTASNSANYDGISIGASRIRGSILYSSPKMQEVILYNSDETANRTSIETDINDFYSIY